MSQLGSGGTEEHGQRAECPGPPVRGGIGRKAQQEACASSRFSLIFVDIYYNFINI